jgi:hypothetical protein
VDPEGPRPTRPREWTWFWALVIAGCVGALGIAIWMYWIAPAMFR